MWVSMRFTDDQKVVSICGRKGNTALGMGHRAGSRSSQGRLPEGGDGQLRSDEKEGVSDQEKRGRHLLGSDITVQGTGEGGEGLGGPHRLCVAVTWKQRGDR